LCERGKLRSSVRKRKFTPWARGETNWSGVGVLGAPANTRFTTGTFLTILFMKVAAASYLPQKGVGRPRKRGIIGKKGFPPIAIVAAS